MTTKTMSVCTFGFARLGLINENRQDAVMQIKNNIIAMQRLINSLNEIKQFLKTRVKEITATTRRYKSTHKEINAAAKSEKTQFEVVPTTLRLVLSLLNFQFSFAFLSPCPNWFS